MAELAASPSCVEPYARRFYTGERRCLPRTSKSVCVGCGKYSGTRSGVMRCSWKTPGPCLNSEDRNWQGRRDSFSRGCLGSLEDFDGLTASDLVSVNDQLLLAASIFLTYVAGVIPNQWSDLAYWKKNVVDDNVVDESAMSLGSTIKNDDQTSLMFAWYEVKEKLLYSLKAMEQRTNFEKNRVFELELPHKQRTLSLYGISEGPKLRLLWASFRQLEEEVSNALGDCKTITMDDWLRIFPEVIKRSYQPACMAWLVEELQLWDNNSDKALILSVIDKLNGDEAILQSIRKSGKEDLYVELLYFLRFGSLRSILGKLNSTFQGCHAMLESCRMKSSFNSSFFILHGPSILEDLVINFADGVASVYLELISVDGKLSNELNGRGMALCSLSTRALQRLRNEVALSKWFYQNVEAVVSMYEDRFDLCTLQLNAIQEPSQELSKDNSWWKRLMLGKSRTSSPSLWYVTISPISIPVKRTKELRALSGWRYYYSLYLELLDISMPLIRAVIDKLSNAVSFFLVALIGRSLGLIYTGIRQSLRWK